MGTDISDGHQMAKHRLQYPLSIPYLRAISCRVARFVSPYQPGLYAFLGAMSEDDRESVIGAPGSS